MYGAMWRRRRKRTSKSQQKWRKSLERKRRLESELEKAREYTKPDRWFNVNGVVVGVHVLRNRFRGTKEYRFEFFRKDGAKRQLTSDFGEHDLDTLVTAVRAAKQYPEVLERRPRAAPLQRQK